MPGFLSPRAALGFLVAALVIGTTASTVSGGFAGVEGSSHPGVEYTELEDGTVLWPYHSHTPKYETRTLPINLVIYGDAAATKRLLLEGGVGEWEELPEERQDVEPTEPHPAMNGTAVGWDPANGANRFVYLEPAGEKSPRWTRADYQLRDGDYLGSREHVRAYVDPVGGDWIAMQAHREHWDWFQLRHTVHSVDESQKYVEEQFLGRWYVADLRREYVGNDEGSDADGWMTVIELESWLSITASLVLTGSITTYARRVEVTPEHWRTASRIALLGTAVIAPYLFVRFGAIAVERTVPRLDPRLIVAVFHPVLVVGVPVSTYLSARALDEIRAFAVASIAFLVALFIDYTFLGVGTLPLDTILHHVAVAAAIGFIAAGASRRARSPDTELGHVRTGVLLWIVAGALPLLRFVPLI